MYTPREPAISPFKPINRLLKTDCYNGTNQNRLNTFEHKMLRINGHLIRNTQLDLIKKTADR